MIPFLLGIAGPSCAGKTTVAKLLQEMFPDALIVSQDQYWKDTSKFPRVGENKNWELPENLDFDTLARNLQELKSGKSTQAPLWKYKEEGNPHQQTLVPASFIIVEGFLLFHDERIRNLLDMKFYIDIPEDAIVARRVARNRRDEGDRELYYREVVVQEYRKHGLPTRKFADVVVDGLASPESTAHYIAAEFRSREARLLHAQRDP
jgi:uridine kinase